MCFLILYVYVSVDIACGGQRIIFNSQVAQKYECEGLTLNFSDFMVG